MQFHYMLFLRDTSKTKYFKSKKKKVKDLSYIGIKL